MINRKKIILPIILSYVFPALCLLQAVQAYSQSSPEQIVLSHYKRGREIVKNQLPAQQDQQFLILLDEFLAKDEILKRICPGFPQLSRTDQERVKEVVIKKIVKIYANIFKKHCQSGQDLVIKGSRKTGSNQIRVKGNVKHPNTGQKIELDLVLEDDKLLDILVSNGLSLLKTFEKTGAENWRKANQNVDQFIVLYKKN